MLAQRTRTVVFQSNLHTVQYCDSYHSVTLQVTAVLVNLAGSDHSAWLQDFMLIIACLFITIRHTFTEQPHRTQQLLHLLPYKMRGRQNEAEGRLPSRVLTLPQFKVVSQITSNEGADHKDMWASSARVCVYSCIRNHMQEKCAGKDEKSFFHHLLVRALQPQNIPHHSDYTMHPSKL